MDTRDYLDSNQLYDCPMSDPQVTEMLTHLAHRGAVLQRLHEGMSNSREIAAEISKSRSSVDRDIRLLKEDDFIDESVDGYALTPYGEFALEVYRAAEQLASAKTLVPHLPVSAPFALLQDATIRETGGTLPQQPVNHVSELIETSEHVKIAAPVVLSPLTEDLAERIQDEAMTVDVIVAHDVLNQLWTIYEEEVHTCLENQSCSLRETDEELSFGLVIADDETMCLGVFDDSMRLLGTITNGSEDAVEWALKTFHEYRDASDEVFLRGTTSQMDGVTTV